MNRNNSFRTIDLHWATNWFMGKTTNLSFHGLLCLWNPFNGRETLQSHKQIVLQIYFTQPRIPRKMQKWSSHPSLHQSTHSKTGPDLFCKRHWASTVALWEVEVKYRHVWCCVCFLRLADAAVSWWGTGLPLSGKVDATEGWLLHRWILPSPLHRWTKCWFACFASMQ